MSDQLQELPILALRGLNIFPGTIMHFDVKRQKSINALDHAMKHGQKIFLVAQKQHQTEDPKTTAEIYVHGTISRIKQIIKLPNIVLKLCDASDY